MLCALIMAGGKGTRFWPLSTEEKPKQFLKLLGEDTMLQMTVNRLGKLINIERVFIVTGKCYVDLVKEQLPELPERNIIVEPVGKNTAPCIALSAFHINKIYEDATIAVLPSDHLIKQEDKFLEVLRLGEEFVSKNEEAIVTIGMKPDRPETGYGYIKLMDQMDNENIYKVEKFVEKPSIVKAKEYVEQGNFLWNGGMFIWKADNILKLTSQHLENTFNVLSEIAATSEENYEKVLEEKYNYVDSVSVDYGIMEKAEHIYVIPGEFGWDDVGSWSSVERYKDKDEYNNACLGNVKSIESTNNIVISSSKPIVLAGIENILVVESEDIIFIGKKEKIGDIKKYRDLVC